MTRVSDSGIGGVYIPRGQRPDGGVVQPVVGTIAAVEAEQTQELAAHHAPHILEQVGTEPPKGSPRGIPHGMSPTEAADRIVAQLLQGTGPIVLLVSGTLGVEYQTSMLAIGRSVLKLSNTSNAPTVASIPYDNGIGDIVSRTMGKGENPSANVLSLVLHKLKKLAANRPVYIAGESQGSWMVSDTLRKEPELAAFVSRVAIFSKPGFVPLPMSVGSAAEGAVDGARGLVEWRQTDDIVPALFKGINASVVGSIKSALAGLVKTGKYEYPQHHYERFADDAARWLLYGVKPAVTQLPSTQPLPNNAAS